jgi:DNA-binding response OmpR family regulator
LFVAAAEAQEQRMQAVKVLLVEDDLGIVEILSESLTDEGFSVDCSTTAEEAMSRLSEPDQAYKAVLTDIRLPGTKSGWDVGHHAREVAPAMPILYVSGDSGDLWSAHGVPGSMFIQKPFVIAQIITALTTLLNASQQAQSTT